jgi:D-alanyl-D-alanine carboxypeptidase (penicillin-binding protein 5/6)
MDDAERPASALVANQHLSMINPRLLLCMLIAGTLAATGSAAPKKGTGKPAASTPAKPAAESEEDEAGEAKEEPKKNGEKKELAPGELPIVARAAMVLDTKTGEVLYEKNADALEYPASATKVLTALLVLEAGDLDKVVTIEESDTKVEPSSLELKPGETYPRRHLLYALLLKSANDVAMALARDNAGSVEAFAKKMTERAHALGGESSHFKNPHGLHDPHHYTTARDLARIGRAAMQNPLFREIVATRDAWMVKADQWIYFRNHNRLLARMPECIGVKTGFTRAAQQVLVSAATKEGREVVSVVLHTNKPGIWDDSKLLLTHGLTKLTTPVPAPISEPTATPGTPPATPVAPPVQGAAIPASTPSGSAQAGRN